MRSVFIVGNSLFAEGIAQTLVSSGVVEVIGSTPTVETALPLLETECPDVVIVVSADETTPVAFGPILSTYPTLPIIHADSDADSVQVITSQRVNARSSDLLSAIAAMPKRR